MVRHPSPEQLHYDTIEKFIQTSIRSGADFLFDKDLFDVELRRLWETYNVPYPVSKTAQPKSVRVVVMEICTIIHIV